MEWLYVSITAFAGGVVVAKMMSVFLPDQWDWMVRQVQFWERAQANIHGEDTEFHEELGPFDKDNPPD